uniref:Uncharacterized protein n=1 Tax=Spermophilus dauricus TaxID=99837 RepID=A0A8C9Q9Q4_SPEDA
MNSILSHCCVPFTPIDFHYIKNRAQFFVQDASTASALKDVNCKICDEENQKISIFVNPCTEPNILQNKFTPEKMEKLMLTMNKRYDVSQQALDLQKLRFDPDLMEHDIDMILNRRQCMFATLQIIERNFPELLSLNLCNNKLYWLDGLSDIVEKAPQIKILNLSKNELRTSKELVKLKGMKLEELWLEGNPLCSDFPEQSAYTPSVISPMDFPGPIYTWPLALVSPWACSTPCSCSATTLIFTVDLPFPSQGWPGVTRINWN